jgi:homoserine dehydrogenase
VQIKLLASAYREGNEVRITVAPEELAAGHWLSAVSGTNKGVVFTTDVMGEVAVLGGASNPRAAAAAALKDIINLYR